MSTLGRATPYPDDVRIKVATLMAAGRTYNQIHEETGVHPTTCWRWATQDEDFQRIREKLTEYVILANVQDLRALSTKAIRALERGLDATVRTQAMVVDGRIETIALEDHSLSVRAADLVLKRIAEFSEQTTVNVKGSLLESWMDELEVPDDVSSLTE